MYLEFSSLPASVWQSTLTWLMFWAVMTAAVCVIIHRSNSGPRQGQDR